MRAKFQTLYEKHIPVVYNFQAQTPPCFGETRKIWGGLYSWRIQRGKQHDDLLNEQITNIS